ncbi:MAG: UDP-N-acetylmuramoyl-L-alanine--D-glutamate ligase [Holosporales bacterium]|jgi:UDP-N-acetylmuramoylalanine--D-glutamate ligase|nr:UDP-N-acetylmuramoyl-L-alanine--D-glutamate ligase [Holosporales bacterium]
MEIHEILSVNKNILVFGYGISGAGAYKFLKNRGHNVSTFDEFKSDIPNKITTIDFKKIDFIVKSPSIPYLKHNIHPVLKEAQEHEIPILSNFDVFKLYNPNAKIIAVTGTNGKSTTTSLIYQILKKAKYSASMGGNIGISYFDLPKSDYYVFEMSSYELASSRYLDFEIGCVLNIEPDHISFHDSFENYIFAKHLLIDHSKTKVISQEDKLSMEKYWNLEGLITVSTSNNPTAHYYVMEGALIDSGIAIIDLANLTELRGTHNHQNALFAYAVCRKLGLQSKEIARNIQSFKALSHRMNCVRKIENILFINDSKGTNPGSAKRALETFDGYKIFWLVGGRSKKTDSLEYVSHCLKRVHKIYLFGESEQEFENTFKNIVSTIKCNTMHNALNTAYKDAKKEIGPAVVLLSPMCASFDQFENFEHRGECFVKMVLNLK